MKRRSGLGSLIPGADLAHVDPEMAVIAPVTSIAVNPYQPRRSFAPEALEELTESIRQYGIIQPLTVRRQGNGYELIAGERRLQAARKAGLREVAVVIRDCTDDEMLALALVENLQREDLNAMEAANSYQQLMDEFGLTQVEVSERVGKSRSSIANTLRLLSLPADIQRAVAEDTISEGHARALLAVEEPQRQHELFRETKKKGLSVRALEKLVKAKPKATAKKSADASDNIDPNLLALQDEMQLELSLRVQFKPHSSMTSGTLEIDYYSSSDLSFITDTLRRIE